MWEPERRDHGIAEWSFHHGAAVIPAAELKCERSNTELRQWVAKSQSVQNTRSIWAHLNSSADLAQGAGLFEHVHIKTGTKE